MLTSLEWQTLEQQRSISRLVMMYKIQHQLVDIDQDLYLRPGDSRTIGQHRFFQKLLPKNSTRVEPRIVKFLVVHSLGDISCVCLACLVPQNLKQSATTMWLYGVCLIYWLRFQNFLQKDMYILDNSPSQLVFHVRNSTCPSYIYLRAGFNVAAEP
jgi:hypothetical protein